MPDESTTPEHWQALIPLKGLSEIEQDILQTLLIEHGASGTVLEDKHLLAYFSHNEIQVQETLEALTHEIPFTYQLDQIVQKNWLEECQTVWKPVSLAGLTVVPTMLEEIPQCRQASEIFVYPSTGFGTGHHSTTKMLLLLLQESELRALQAKRVLDFGTGSGILTVAAQRLYHSEVDAIDNDPLAISNAEVTIALNNTEDCNKPVHLKLGSIEQVHGPYDLVIANLYAELLTSYAETLVSSTRSHGLLLLSGILEHHWAAVHEVFEAEGCQLIRSLLNSETFADTAGERRWMAALYRKQ